jgi:hypothetical protein
MGKERHTAREPAGVWAFEGISLGMGRWLVSCMFGPVAWSPSSSLEKVALLDLLSTM